MAKDITVAIGDIHGMATVLAILLDELERTYASQQLRFVFLGDVIDRGEHSLQAMNLVCRMVDRYPTSVVVLGNHDEFLLKMIQADLTEEEHRKWMMLGGIETLQSYAVDHYETDSEIVFAMRRSRPRHIALLENAVSMVITERHCFVHAGIDPGRPLTDQDTKDLRYIRKGFLDYAWPMEKIVVHGHSITPSNRPEVFHNRIAIDTGSYQSGRICAAVFEDDQLAEFCSAEFVNGNALIQRYDPTVRPIDQ